MCIICIDFDRRAMNVAEARRALGEMTGKLPPGHAAEVQKRLDEAERDAASKAKTP